MKECACGCGRLVVGQWARGHNPKVPRKLKPDASISSRCTDPAERFALRANSSGGPDACWPWMGGLNASGYGVTRFGGIRKSAHRLSYELAHGPLGANEWVLHTCDNRKCVNPAHLYKGHAKENAADMVSRNRQRLRFGEEHPAAKLDRSKVLRIRELFAHGMNKAAIAREIGVSRSSVVDVLSGRVWSHVLEDLNR